MRWIFLDINFDEIKKLVIKSLFVDDDFYDLFVLKGGNALSIAYKLSNRSSKDVDILKVKDIVYKSSNKKFYIDGNEIELTHLEHDLLLEFIKNKDILLSREHLLTSVWQDSFEKKEKTVNVAIKRLKAKIDPDAKKEYIRSIRGEGYIFC